jgi:hypothetical protein
MALLNAGDVVQSTATLLDDPSQSTFDMDYIVPFLNLNWDSLVVTLAMLGLQYTEEEAIVQINAGTTSLSSLLISGGPLAALMEPKRMDWKLVGDDDTMYTPVEMVEELDDYPQGTIGVEEFSWKGGNLFLTPSAQPVVLRIRYTAMSVTLVDPTDNMIRGAGHILAFYTAGLIWDIRGNARLATSMTTRGDNALEDFCAMSTMRSQTKLTTIPAAHRRQQLTPFGVISNP